MTSTIGGHPRLRVVTHPLLQIQLTVLRDQATLPAAFRGALDVASLLLVAAALEEITTVSRPVRTPLGMAEGQVLARPLVLVPILRAGLGMVHAAQRLAPDASVWHLGLYRDEATLQPVTYYSRIERADLSNSTVLVLDPMLATAGSAVAALDELRTAGARHLSLVALVAAPEGLTLLADRFPEVPVTVGVVDERLSGPDDPWPTGYILPGLGDAGDRQFGTG